MQKTWRTRLTEISPGYRRTQREGRALYRAWAAIPFPSDFIHPLWEDARVEFEEMAANGVPDDFLNRQIVRHMLYCTGFGELEEMELDYIDGSPEWIRSLCHAYRESAIGQPLADCEAFGVSVSSLNKLYYFARIAQRLEQPATIVDFGGGYGHMCHVFQQLQTPPPTYVIVDLPELLALQYTFLRASGLAVRTHTSAPVELEPGVANLVPVQLLGEVSLRCDLFLSTFALSETPIALRRLVIERSFFEAKSIYLTGQVTDSTLWDEYALQEMSDVHTAVRRLFQDVRLESIPAVSAWELMAQRSPES